MWSGEQFVSDESGQDLIEYALMALIVGLVALTALSGPATAVLRMLALVTTALNR